MKKTMEERFWEKVNKTDTCWIWTANKIRGYGHFKITPNKTVKAHRLSYELLVKPIPEGLTIDHLCRNKSCVNPAHLEPVTIQENIRRSNNVTAMNSRRTECINGHPFSQENTYITSDGKRMCSTCNHARTKSYRQNIEYRNRQNALKRERRKINKITLLQS